MIGKTLYKAKVKDGVIVMESRTIIQETNKFYYFDKVKKINARVPKIDVGVTCFLTKEKAIDYLVTKLKLSIEMGKKYIKKEESLLEDAILFLEP